MTVANNNNNAPCDAALLAEQAAAEEGMRAGLERTQWQIAAVDATLWEVEQQAARCLEEGILDRPSDGDVGAVLGLGFPPFIGGPFRYLDALGIPLAISRLERLAADHGPVFEPPELLRRSLPGFHA